MNTTEHRKPPSKLVLTAQLSGGLTIIICISYIILCTIALIYRNNCDITSPEEIGTNHLWKIIYLSYIQDGCGNKPWLTNLDVTTPYTVFVLLLITLSASIVCLIMASVLTAVVCNNSTTQYTLNVTVYAYVGFSLASLVVDLTLATHFGMDYTFLGSTGMTESDHKYDLFAIYYGAFVMMTISLKGFVAHACNLVLLVLLVIYAVENWNRQKDEHSIHKMGVLDAFESQRKHEDSSWSHHPNYPPFARSSQMNNGFIIDEDRPRSPVREVPRSDILSNRSFDRSDSWHHSRAMPDPGQGSRPFSYLEEMKRPVAVRPPASPVAEPWRRDQWPQVAGPPVPAPDYSPQAPRRLKSALKSGYM